MQQTFTPGQVALLESPLDSALVSHRKDTGSKELSYIEGRDAIDQGNRIFGYGNWAYRAISCEMVVIHDPLTGEAVGVTYKAHVEVTVRGAIAPIIEVGSQAVASWNIEEQLDRMEATAKKYGKKFNRDSSRATAREIIMKSHENSEKGAVTDAMKRGLRAFGNQFGNGLYGKGQKEITHNAPVAQPVSPAPVAEEQITTPIQAQPAASNDEALATADQIKAIRFSSLKHGKNIPNLDTMTISEAAICIQQLNRLKTKAS